MVRSTWDWNRIRIRQKGVMHQFRPFTIYRGCREGFSNRHLIMLWYVISRGYNVKTREVGPVNLYAWKLLEGYIY